MKAISLLDLLNSLADLLAQTKVEALILKTSGGKEFVLATLDDFAHEVELNRQNLALMLLLDQRGQEKTAVKLSDLKIQLVLD